MVSQTPGQDLFFFFFFCLQKLSSVLTDTDGLPDRSKVDVFYTKALEAGGKDNGAPGPRPQFGPHYYAAFLIDPMGNNVEVVCRKEE